MNLDTGKEQFIQEWGKLGSSWGINKTMGQIHALLLISPDPLCACDLRAQLDISSGNANTNIRSLVDWGLVNKVEKQGERKDFFEAEKDMWKIFTCIIVNRKKRELDPMIELLDSISGVEGVCTGSKEFCRVVTDLKMFSTRADKALNNLASNKSKWLLTGVMKAMR